MIKSSHTICPDLAGGEMIMGEFHMIALKINNYNEMETKKLAVAQATMEYLKN
jgi:hypothetical protein